MRETLASWRSRARNLDLGGLAVSAVDVAPVGDERGAPLLVLHGFPTSSFDFHRCLDGLARGRRVVLHDHPGFGLSAKPAEYSYSLLEQAEVALGVWRELGVRSGHLLAHDYGTSVATEVLARRERGGIPVELRSVTLTNGSVHLDLAKLRVSQRLARSPVWGPLLGRVVWRGYFKSVLRRLWGRRSRARDEDLDAMWEGVRYGNGHLRTHQISTYLDERRRFERRWVGALERLDVPVHVLWGRRDPVAVPAIAERLAAEIPDAELTWLEDLGHYPMLEDPERFSAAVLAFLERVDST